MRAPPIHNEMPHSQDAERGVLGSILLDPKLAIAECVSVMSPDWFFIPTNRTLYDILVNLWTTGEGIDLITLTQLLRDKGLLEGLGGASYITSLYTFVPTAANIHYYIDIMRDKHILRQIIQGATEGVRRAYEDPEDADRILEELQANISNIATHKTSVRKSLQTLVSEKIERMERGESDTDLVGTGLERLDYYSPLRKGDMPILSGETKSGKTMLALSIAANIAKQGTGVGIFSLESPVQELVDRLLAGIARIPISKQDRASNLTSEELHRSTVAATALSNLPLYPYDDVFDLHHIIAEARRLKEQRDVGLLIVDYAQLVRTKIQKDRNREQEVASISRGLRLLSLQLKVPVLLLSQLNEDGRSRESRALEQDCTAMWKLKLVKDEPGMRYIGIPFQRNGQSGIQVPVTFLGEIGRVETFVQEHATYVSTYKDNPATEWTFNAARP